MAQIGGASIQELLTELARSFELPQMPFRQRKEVRRDHLRIIAEAEQRFSIAFMNIIAQCPLKRLSRSLQVAE